MDYTDLGKVKALLSDAQEAEHDNRERVRAATHFLEKEDGQWEPEVSSNMQGRPRYTFDKCNPVVDSIAGELEQAEFGIKIRPAGGDATKDNAKIFDGLIRNIEAMSGAKHIYTASGRKMVSTGFDCWRVVQEWADDDSFEQDLLIKKIANAVDRVWFDTGAEMQDMSDANWCFVLQTITKDKYAEKFPEGTGQSLSDDKSKQVYSHKADLIVVGEFLYKKPTSRELVLMSNNKVYAVDDDYESVAAELAEAGVTEIRRRKRKGFRVYSRLFDGAGWLGGEQETVFDYIPVVPTYGNFDISEDKVIYRGAIAKLMDAQRVYNYAQSRAIEEGALAPRAKYWMTREQAEKDIDTLRTMNTNTNPVQFYSHVDNQPPPFWQGGAQINAGLSQTAGDMSNNIIEGSGVFAANQGNAPNQSGYAIELQQNKGDNATIKYFTSQEIAISHTAKILVNAIPRVYDTNRMVRILGEDGVAKMESINDQVFDQETKQTVVLNDLRKGKYDVVCDVGPAFKSRQQETARAFIDIATIDPTLIQDGKDVWLSNLNAPGMEVMAERARKRLLESGSIPDSQMTDEEKEAMQRRIAELEAEAEAQGPSAVDIAVIEQTQANTADIQSKAQERMLKAELERDKHEFDVQKFAADMDLRYEKQMADMMKIQADTLNVIRQAIGADAVVTPEGAQAYQGQAEEIVETQQGHENTQGLAADK